MNEWIRVTRHHRCPICDGDSWCTFNDDVALCMREQSRWEKVMRDGSVGWIHKLREDIKPRQFVKQYKPQKSELNVKLLLSRMSEQTNEGHIARLASNLGVSKRSLWSLGCRWSDYDKAYAFPMYDEHGNPVGIRLRNMKGYKWAVKGSRQGVFMSLTDADRRVFVCEGPTDTAAALTLGLYAIGRPHCSGGTREIPSCCRRNQVLEAVIVSDNDGPGRTGAINLAHQLNIPCAILVMPCKDIRKFLNSGGTKDDLEELVSNLSWRIQPATWSRPPG